MIKGYPLVCLPALLVAVPPHRRRRYLKSLGLTLLIGFLPFLILSPSGLWHSITYHTGRPIEILSGPAAVGYLLHAFGASVSRISSHFSVGLQFSAEPFINLLSSVLLAIGLIALAVYLFRRRTTKIVTSCLAFLLIFIVFFKVGSPQYFVPVLMLTPLAASELSKRDYFRLRLRLILIGLAILSLASYGDRAIVINLGWLGQTLAILRIALSAELLIWLLRRLKTKAG